jgi:prophage regulatory protein
MRLLKRPEVEAKTTLRRSQIYLKMSQGKFPRAVKAGNKAVAWLESEIDAGIAERIAERDQAA